MSSADSDSRSGGADQRDVDEADQDSPFEHEGINEKVVFETPGRRVTHNTDILVIEAEMIARGERIDNVAWPANEEVLERARSRVELIDGVTRYDLFSTIPDRTIVPEEEVVDA
jgi:hypothetical protein